MHGFARGGMHETDLLRVQGHARKIIVPAVFRIAEYGMPQKSQMYPQLVRPPGKRP